MIRGSWIPPVPLALGALFAAASWVLVFAYARDPSFGLAVAWVHAVALGGFTTIALSVLIHVVPGFTDLTWRFERLARWCAVALPFAAVGLVVSFVAWDVSTLAGFATAAALAILGYVAAAITTLLQPASDPAERAIARAFTGVLVFLGITGALGAAMAIGLNTGNAASLRLAPVHATTGLVGWLTLLTMGVSARTFRPILGSVSRWRALHVFSNAGMMACAVFAAIGFAVGQQAIVTAAFVVGFASAVSYALDGLDRVRRATTPHAPAHIFVVASLVWLIVATAAAAVGNYELAVIVALAGWLGQMVNAHLHHLGIRVIATTVGGDDNETRPWELLDLRVEWFTALCAQAAVVALIFAAFDAAAILGLSAMIAFGVNVWIAVRKTPGLA